MPLDPAVRFIVWPNEDGQYGARADVLDHPYEHLSAFANTPQEALRELIEIVIPTVHETLTEEERDPTSPSPPPKPHNNEQVGVLLREAWCLAERVHRGQLDLRGRPFMLHPLEVAADVAEFGWEAVVVALLHDVLEDGGEHVDVSGFPPEVQAAVHATTRMAGERYVECIERVSEDRLARLVKIADLRRNLATCPSKSLRMRYATALRDLEANS